MNIYIENEKRSLQIHRRSNMDDVFFFKFDSDSETARAIVEKYPPNARQRTICDRLGVSPLLWSFYVGKVKKSRSRFCEEADEAYMALYISRFDFYSYQDLNLTSDEKWFICNRYSLERALERCLCVSYVPPALQEQCIKTLVENWGDRLEGLSPSLCPRSIIQRLLSRNREEREETVSMPEREDLPKDTFKRKDGVFSKEFVAWFQRDYHRFQSWKESHKLIYFYFRYGLASLLICMGCLKDRVRNNRIVGPFERIYLEMSYFYEVTTARFWCTDCRQVPLFQVLNRQDFRDQYGDKKNIWVEFFIY